MTVRSQVAGSMVLAILVLGMVARLRAEPRQIASIEGITEYRLENGVQVLLYPDASRPTVTVNVTYFVGSRHEGYGEAGMAHLLEHMLFKGTPAHPDIPKVLQERGARFNGTTWVDRTNYYETLPASDENLEFALRLEADRMVNSYVRGEDLASEMSVVRNEFERGENSPRRILHQRMQAAAYEWHNYGKSTIGNRSDIERVPIEKLRSFYRRFYQPDNAMLVVAGKFDPQVALKLIDKYFGLLAKPERTLDTTYTEEPPQDGERQVTLRRVGELALVSVAYHIPAGAHPDYAATDVLGYLLATEPAGRLYKALVVTEKAAAISGQVYAWHDPGLLQMTAEVRQGQSLDEAREILIREMEEFAQQPPTDEELERVKQQIAKARELSLNDSGRIAIELSEWAAQGDWRLFFLYRDRVEQVTVSDVQRVAAAYLRRANRTLGLFIPAEEPERVAIPLTPDPAEALEGYQGRQVVEAGEAFDPAPQNVEQRTIRKTLPSGVQLALLPKKTRGRSVNLLLTMQYGNADSLQGLTTAGELLPELMTRGTTKMDFQQIQDTLDRHRVQLSASGSRARASFQVRTNAEGLPVALELLGDILRKATLPADQFEILKRQQLAGLDSQRTEPHFLAAMRLRQELQPYPQGDIRRVLSIEEQIQELQQLALADVQKLYREFLGTESVQIVVLGDFEPSAVEPALDAIFKDWKASHTYSRIGELAFTDVKAQQLTINVPEKANAAYYGGLMVPITDTHPDYPALVIGNYILGGGSLSSRLGDRIRQKEGLSYGVGSGFSGNSLDEASRLMVAAISAPENAPKVIQAVREELERLLKDGVTQEELDRAKQGYLQSEQVGRTDDRRLAVVLRNTVYEKRTMAYHADYERKIAELTTEDVLQALRKHFDLKHFIGVVAGTFPDK